MKVEGVGVGSNSLKGRNDGERFRRNPDATEEGVLASSKKLTTPSECQKASAAGIRWVQQARGRRELLAFWCFKLLTGIDGLASENLRTEKQPSEGATRKASA